MVFCRREDDVFGAAVLVVEDYVGDLLVGSVGLAGGRRSARLP